jgi:hypothetical protein
MGTLVAPIGSATVAIPAAKRWSDLHAVVVLPVRLNIVGDVEDVDELEGRKREVEDQDAPAASGPREEFMRNVILSGPVAEANRSPPFTPNLRAPAADASQPLADAVRLPATPSASVKFDRWTLSPADVLLPASVSISSWTLIEVCRVSLAEIPARVTYHCQSCSIAQLQRAHVGRSTCWQSHPGSRRLPPLGAYPSNRMCCGELGRRCSTSWSTTVLASYIYIHGCDLLHSDERSLLLAEGCYLSALSIKPFEYIYVELSL